MKEKVIVRSFNSLKANSYRIDGTIRVLIPSEDSFVHGEFDPTLDLSTVEHCYHKMDGVIAFVCEGALYAIPYCEKAERILLSEGFEQYSHLKVPFTFGTCPQDNSLWWYKLLAWQAHRQKVENDEKRMKEAKRIHVVRIDRYAAAF